MIKIKSKGDFRRTETFLKKYTNNDSFLPIMEKYGARGVELLSQATPIDTSQTANAWDYVVENDRNECRIIFTNSNENNGVNIAIILQYGHGTRNGGYVQGRDYINPAIKQAFEEMRDELIKEVKRI